MEIIAMSDFHGNLINIDSEFDLLLICGDICPTNDHSYKYQSKWLFNNYVNWIKKLPFKNENSKVVMIPGNHDFWFEDSFNADIDTLCAISGDRLVVLKNETYTFNNGDDTKVIFGTPYCKRFGEWAFMRGNDELRELYKVIPQNVDILLTHDAPSINNLGLITEGWSVGTNASNIVLGDEITLKQPKLVLCGHIHSGNHELTEYSGGQTANVSICNEYYEPINKIFKITL